MEDRLKQVKIIHMALVMGATFFLLVFSFIMFDFKTMTFNTDSHYLFTLLAAWVFVFFLQKVGYNRIKNGVDENDSNDSKLQQYTSAKIIVWASFEGIAMISTVFLQLEQNAFFFISAVVAICILILKRARPEEQRQDFKIVNELK